MNEHEEWSGLKRVVVISLLAAASWAVIALLVYIIVYHVLS
jgi:hypothetical protein